MPIPEWHQQSLLLDSFSFSHTETILARSQSVQDAIRSVSYRGGSTVHKSGRSKIPREATKKLARKTSRLYGKWKWLLPDRPPEGASGKTLLGQASVLWLLPNSEIRAILQRQGAYLVAQMVKNPPAKWESWVRSLGCEDPLEEDMATHVAVFLPGGSPWAEEPGGLQSMGLQRVRHGWGALGG